MTQQDLEKILQYEIFQGFRYHDLGTIFHDHTRLNSNSCQISILDCSPWIYFWFYPGVEKLDSRILQTRWTHTKIIRKMEASEIFHRFLICDSDQILIKPKISYNHIIRSNDTERSFKNLITRIHPKLLRLQFSVGFVSNLARSYTTRSSIFSGLTA